MLIDRIYQKVKTFVNTDGRGNVSPAEFNLFLHDAIQSRNEEYFHEINQLINKQNRGLVTNALENTPDRYREKASHYLVSGEAIYESEGIYILPKDYRYIDMLGKDDQEYTYCGERQKFVRTKPYANTKNPIFMLINNRIQIYPIGDVLVNIPITYLRKVKFPKWTYMVINGAEIFNSGAGDFQDADIHPSEEDEMVMRVCLRFGVNLKEEDIKQFAQSEDNKEFNQNYRQ